MNLKSLLNTMNNKADELSRAVKNSNMPVGFPEKKIREIFGNKLDAGVERIIKGKT